MKNLIKSKIFIGVFLIAYFAFFAITIFILEVKSKGFGAGHLEYGFPFTYYYSSCFGGDYLWSGLAGNILFAALLSFFVALGFVVLWSKRILPLWQKVTSSEFRKKWYL